MKALWGELFLREQALWEGLFLREVPLQAGGGAAGRGRDPDGCALPGRRRRLLALRGVSLRQHNHICIYIRVDAFIYIYVYTYFMYKRLSYIHTFCLQTNIDIDKYV